LNVDVVGDYCAIQIFDYVNFEEIAIFRARIGSLTKYSDIVKFVIKYLYDLVGDKIMVTIENNSMGVAVVENLENDESDFDYVQFLFETETKNSKGVITKVERGLNTNAKTKDQMVSIFYEYVTKEPKNIHSAELISQLSIIERKSTGSISAASGYHDDNFMAACMCAYTKKMRSLDIEPLVTMDEEAYHSKKDDTISNMFGVMDRPRNEVRSYFQDVEGFQYNQFDSSGTDEDDVFDASDLPFFM
jgi:hypothetical protein